MLDSNMLNQLKTVFEKLEKPVDLYYSESSNEKQQELVEMLEQVASTSDNISATRSEEKTDDPSFKIRYQGKENGISFVGIPGGHEFTSLILAILNSDQKGKLPDENIVNKIRGLKGPIKLKTYISLSCDNCPEVVQALNLMAIYHDDFEHEMIDGAFRQQEIDELKIQGVPSVIHEGKLLSSGKTNLMELLERLGKAVGTDENQEVKEVDLGDFDVAVLGGGPAGGAAAIYAARKGLKTIVIAEQIGGQVQDTKGIENLISIPYIEGPQLAAKISHHMEDYQIKVLEHRRVEHIEAGDTRSIFLNSGERLNAKAVIVATGAKWRQLGIPGEKDYIGRGVAFCPHCDGPYYKGKDIAVIGGGNSGVEAAIDLAGMVKSVTLLEFADELKADQVLIDKLSAMSNVTIIKSARTSEVIGDGDKVKALKYEDRSSGEELELNLDGIFVQIGLQPNSGFIKDLVEINKMGEVIVDERCRTNIKGIYGAGDVTNIPYKQIIISMGEGAKAGLTVFEDIALHNKL